MYLLSRSSAIVLLALVSACSSLKQTEQPPAPVEDRTERPTVAPPAPPPQEEVHRPASPSANAAWQPLLAQAEQATGRGDYEQALALLERAQRIDPDSGAVYLEMAKTHAARGDAAQARAVAERGLLYCVSASQCEALRRFTR